MLGTTRPGAGRKPKPVVPLAATADGVAPLDFLLSVMRDPLAAPPLKLVNKN